MAAVYCLLRPRLAQPSYAESSAAGELRDEGWETSSPSGSLSSIRIDRLIKFLIVADKA